jgi:putative acetyltransferase
LKEDTVYRISS